MSQARVSDAAGPGRRFGDSRDTDDVAKHDGRQSFNNKEGPMTAVLGPCCERFCTVYIDGSLLAPIKPDLLRSVCILLGRGERSIGLDLSSVARIDAGGVGELVRAYNVACARNVSLRIVNTTKWVRETLERVGLFDLLSAEGDAA
jgi:anti-anti-sigma regulatory factor